MIFRGGGGCMSDNFYDVSFYCIYGWEDGICACFFEGGGGCISDDLFYVNLDSSPH